MVKIVNSEDGGARKQKKPTNPANEASREANKRADLYSSVVTQYQYLQWLKEDVEKLYTPEVAQMYQRAMSALRKYLKSTNPFSL